MAKSQVLILIGSDSDYEGMKPCFDTLQDFGVCFRLEVCSAHRSPAHASAMAQTAAEQGFQVIIAAAGLAAHLPGVLAAYTTLPVIGVPISSGALRGMDALLAIAQMPPGVPVAAMAIDGAANAAVLASQMLAIADPQLRKKLDDYKNKLEQTVVQRNLNVQAKRSRSL